MAQAGHCPLARQEFLQRPQDGRSNECVGILETWDQHVGDAGITHGSERVRGRASDIAGGIVGEEHRQSTHLSCTRRSRRGFSDPQVRVGQQRRGGALRETRHVPRNLETHEPVRILRHRGQKLARMVHQARHRPDRRDADVRDRVGQQPSAVGSRLRTGTLPEPRECLQGSGAHAGNVVPQHRSERVRRSRIAERAECPCRREPTGISLVTERFDCNLHDFAVPDPPQRAGDVSHQREIDVQDTGAQRVGCPRSL
jgi:hypothetical protein